MTTIWRKTDLDELNNEWKNFFKTKRLELLYELPNEIVEWLDELVFIELKELDPEERVKEELFHEGTYSVITSFNEIKVEINKIFYFDYGFSDDSDWLLYGEFDHGFAFSRGNYIDEFSIQDLNVDEDEIQEKIHNLFANFGLMIKFEEYKKQTI